MFNMASKRFPTGFSRFPSHRYDRSRPLKSNCPNFPLRLSKNKSPAEEAGLGRSKRMALGRHRTSVRVPSNHKVPLPYTAANGPYPYFSFGCVLIRTVPSGASDERPAPFGDQCPGFSADDQVGPRQPVDCSRSTEPATSSFPHFRAPTNLSRHFRLHPKRRADTRIQIARDGADTLAGGKFGLDGCNLGKPLAAVLQCRTFQTCGRIWSRWPLPARSPPARAGGSWQAQTQIARAARKPPQD
jgi:hypothetical protein